MTDRRALPGRMVDLIRVGVSPAELRAAGDKAVYKALVRTASSARQRGHDFPEWAALISETASTLGRQARLRSTGKERPRAAYERTLSKAWDQAGAWLDAAPPPLTPADVAEMVAAVVQFVADADADLDDAERAVLAAACRVAQRNGTTRPALPRRALMEETGIGERTIRTVLARLDRRGLLTLEVPGRAGAEGSGRRRAGLYRLPGPEAMGTAYLYRGTRSMGPPAQVYGTPRSPTVGTPAQVYGTPTNRVDNDTEETPEMVTITISANDARALAEAIDVLRGVPAVTVAAPEAAQPPRLSVIPSQRDDRRTTRATRRPA